MEDGALQRRHYVAAIFWVGLMALCYLYFESRQRPAVQVVAGGEIEVPRSPDGHFYVEGAINGKAVTFLIDTGASSVSVSRSTASRLGLSGGVPAQFSTAGGNAVGETYRGLTVSVAGISVEGLNVSALPDMGREALLGQNFLRHLDVLIRDNALVLRPRQTSR